VSIGPAQKDWLAIQQYLRTVDTNVPEADVIGVSRFRKFGQRDKWKVCSLTAIKMAETRSNDDTTSTPESHSSL
jgi:hypothetical protein